MPKVITQVHCMPEPFTIVFISISTNFMAQNTQAYLFKIYTQILLPLLEHDMYILYRDFSRK